MIALVAVMALLVSVAVGTDSAQAHDQCTSYADIPWESSTYNEVRGLGRFSCDVRHDTIVVYTKLQKKVDGVWTDKTNWYYTTRREVYSSATEAAVSCSNGEWRTKSKGEAGFTDSTGFLVLGHMEGPVTSRVETITC